MTDFKLALKPAEAAKLMNVSLPTVYAMINADDGFPAIRIGSTGRGIIIPTVSLIKWLDEKSGGDGNLIFLERIYHSVIGNQFADNSAMEVSNG